MTDRFCSVKMQQQIKHALNQPNVQILVKKLEKLMANVPCKINTATGEKVIVGGGKADLAAIAATVGAITVACLGWVDVYTAMQAQCAGWQMTTSLISGSGYCTSQASLLATTVGWTLAKSAAALGAVHKASKGGGRKKRRKTKRRKRKTRRKRRRTRRKRRRTRR